jgi:ribosomal protein S18 acetylase RimI-like enzyme
MTALIRDARPEDFEAVSALLEELGRPKTLGTPDEPVLRGHYEEWLRDSDRFIFVAEEDGAVIGMVDMAVIGRPNFVQPHAWVPDLIVTEKVRSRGVGAALLGRAEEVARELGAFSMGLESAHWRTRAHDFYVQQGMADVAKHFNKVFVDIPWPPPAAGQEAGVSDSTPPPDASAPGSRS